MTFDDGDAINIPFSSGYSSTPVYFGPGCDTSTVHRNLLPSSVGGGQYISVRTELISGANIQITVQVPRNQKVKIEMLDSTDSTYHKILLEDDLTAGSPVSVQFDLVDIYTSTYEARVIGEDDTVPLILHKKKGN